MIKRIFFLTQSLLGIFFVTGMEPTLIDVATKREPKVICAATTIWKLKLTINSNAHEIRIVDTGDILKINEKNYDYLKKITPNEDGTVENRTVYWDADINELLDSNERILQPVRKEPWYFLLINFLRCF